MSDYVTFSSAQTPAAALVALWNGTQTIGLGFIHSHQQPTEDDAQKHLKSTNDNYVDYFFGRPIKTSFSSFPKLSCSLYDRDAGPGTMQKISQGAGVDNLPTPKMTDAEIKNLVNKPENEIFVLTQAQ